MTIQASHARNIYQVFGGTVMENTTLEGADIVRVYGDLIIPDGVTFTVTPNSGSGCVNWSILGADFRQSGIDPNSIEIVVESGGSLIIEGLETKFKPFRTGGSWNGIKVEPGGYFGAPTFQPDIVIEGTENGLIVNSNSVQVGALTIDSSGNGLVVGGDFICGDLIVQSVGTGIVLDHGGNLFVAGNINLNMHEGAAQLESAVEFYGDSELSCASLTATGYSQGIHLTPNCTATMSGSVQLNDISTFGCMLDDGAIFNLAGLLVIVSPAGGSSQIGLYLRSGSSYSTFGTEITTCGTGVVVLPSDQVQVSGGLVVNDSDTGLSLFSNTLSFTNGSVQFFGLGAGIGLNIHDGFLTSENPVTCSNYDFGFFAIGCDGDLLEGELNISNSNIHGIQLTGCTNIFLRGPTEVRTSGQNGIHLYQSTDIFIQDAYLIENTVSGLCAFAGSSGYIRNSILEENQNGLFVDELSTFEAGKFNSTNGAGLNEFRGPIRNPIWFHISTLNQGQVISAEGNIWYEGVEPSCPPSLTHLLGSVVTTCE